MNPNNGSQGGGQPNPQDGKDTQSAAANVIRTQIDALFGNYSGSPAGQGYQQTQPTQASQPIQPTQQPQAAVPQQTPYQQAQPSPVATPASRTTVVPTNLTPAAIDTPNNTQPLVNKNPYDRTYNSTPQAQSQPQPEQLKSYHSAWQNYYQKYYEAYYTQNSSRLPEPQSATQAQPQNQAQGASSSTSSQNNYFQQTIQEELNEEDLSKNQALFELREKLLGKVKSQATKVRKSRHFIPITAALAVVMIFSFLQYNQVLIASVHAYMSPGAIDPQNIVVDPTSDINVSADPRLVIPKINVDVPVMYGVGYDHASQMKAMENGVAHFGIPGANSRPGEVGNTVLSGHSSNDLFDVGDYKFIFAQLEKLKVGDTIYANYEGTRYTYVITKTEVVKPQEVNKLIYPTDKPVMTLITCTPLGTALNRLLVTAEQISPDPSKATTAPAGSGQDSAEAVMPGSSPTLIERLFGAK